MCERVCPIAIIFMELKSKRSGLSDFVLFCLVNH